MVTASTKLKAMLNELPPPVVVVVVGPVVVVGGTVVVVPPPTGTQVIVLIVTVAVTGLSAGSVASTTVIAKSPATGGVRSPSSVLKLQRITSRGASMPPSEIKPA